MEKEKEPTKKEKSSLMDKQLYWAFGIMVVIIAAFLIGSYVRPNPNSFEYNGLKFEKQMLGNIPLYKTTYFTEKTIRTTGDVINTGESTAVNILLRSDPREIDDIPVEGEIEFLPREYFVYMTVSSSPDLLCEYSLIAMAQISSFLTQNGFKPKAGVSDEQAAQEQDLDYITCENHPERMVISLEAGDENKIVRDGNCYTIYVANCEILKPTEKFIIQSILDAKEE
jgi:hypothetical protein